MKRVVFLAAVLPVLAASGGRAQDEEPTLKPGLVAAYSDGAHAVVALAPAPAFTLSAGQSIHPELGPKFTAYWSGFLQILRAGTYTISGDAQITIDGQDAAGKPLALKPGDHAIRVRYTRAKDDARLLLTWESDLFRSEPVPSKAFGHKGEPPALAAQEQAERGRALVEEANCAACHAGAPASLRSRSGPDLSFAGSRTNARWIAHWLRDPRAFRPGAVMPVVLDTDAERADIATYLAGLKDPKDKGGDLPTDKFRIERGKQLYDSIGCAACHAATGADGLSLAGLGSKYTIASLARYLQDPLAADPSGRMPSFLLSAEEASLIAEHLAQSKNAAFEAEIPAGGSTPLTAGDVARGKDLVASRGCAACHAIADGGAAVKSALEAPAWDRIATAGGKGCLAESPSGRAARYGFSKEQRDRILVFLRTRDVSGAPVHAFEHLVRKFRCTACHGLDASAPVGLAELPPPLTIAGFKLRPSWIRSVLADKKRIRPWMALRMPHFGGANVGSFVPLFAAAVGAEAGEGESPPTPPLEAIDRGIKLIGKNEGGLKCIECHDFHGHASTGTRGPDMIEMTARLRPDYFRRWLRNPGRIIPGTAMPEFFSDMPADQAEAKISVLWACLAAGRSLPLPAGLVETEDYALHVKDEPVLMRTFMPDSPPRSIAVGLPGFLSYCFNAQDCRLQYAWYGDYLDVRPVWTGRGGNPATPLGKRVYTAPDLFPLRVGDPARAPTVKFRGYALVKKWPEFLYEIDGVSVRERLAAPAQGLGIVRAFELGAEPGSAPLPADASVWFLTGRDAPAGGGVAYTASAGEWQGGKLKVPGGKTVSFNVTVQVDEKSLPAGK